MKANIFAVFGVILVISILVIGFLSMPWLLIFTGIQQEPDPPRPEITYGEFPFRLEYEINGQRKVIEDTLICEYDGVGMDEGRGKYRKWKKILATGKERITLLKADDTKEIYYSPGSANYYMGDYGDATYKHNFPNASIKQTNGSIVSNGLINADQLLEEYNIKLISWDYTPPIKNRFSEK